MAECEHETKTDRCWTDNDDDDDDDENNDRTQSDNDNGETRRWED